MRGWGWVPSYLDDMHRTICTAAFFVLMWTVLMGTGSGLAQAEPQAVDRGVFKWVPKEMGEVPAWASLMYSDTDDFEAVVDQRAAWWSERPYEKTLHERNFKHWLMHVEHRVGPDGLVANYMYVWEIPQANNPLLIDWPWPWYLAPLHVALLVHLIVVNALFRRFLPVSSGDRTLRWYE